MDYSSDINYAINRLVGTIVTLKESGRGVRVDHIEGKNSCDLTDIITYKKLTARLFDLNISSPDLGSLNYNGRSFYAARTPMRGDWRQGIRNSNVRFYDKIGLKLVGMSLGGDFMKAFGLMLIREYSPLDKCLDMVANKEVNSISFHRDFSVDSKFNLLYKFRGVVASINPNNASIEVGEKFFWLEEYIKEVFNGQAA